jgi:hypothetical protein
MGKRNKGIVSEFYDVVVTRHAETGIQIAEEWTLDGKPHRDGGPAAVLRDYRTGVVTEECWMRNGRFSRDDGPALIKRDKQTGQIIGVKYVVEGKLEHRYRKPDVDLA